MYSLQVFNISRFLFIYLVTTLLVTVLIFVVNIIAMLIASNLMVKNDKYNFKNK